MADKKNDKKDQVIDTTAVETKPTGSDTSSETAETSDTALAVPAPRMANSLGITIPSEAALNVLEATAQEKLGDFAALMQSDKLSPEIKAKVQLLLGQAQPVREGMEEMNTVWSLPRVQIVQPTSQSSAKPELARPGDLFTSAGALLQRPVKFIPFYFNEENIMFTQSSKAPECIAPDAKLGQTYGLCDKCPHLPFGKQNGGRGDQKKTECNNQIVVAMVAEDLTQAFLVQFAKTSRSAGSALMGLVRTQSSIWKQSYLLHTEKKTADLGVYYVYKIEATGTNNSEEVNRVCQALYHLYKANRARSMGNYYASRGSAAQNVLMAETAFIASKLHGGLDTGDPDLSAEPVAQSSVRGTSKPM